MLSIQKGGDQKLYYGFINNRNEEEQFPYCVVVAKTDADAHKKALESLQEQTRIANETNYKRQSLRPKEPEPIPKFDDIWVQMVTKDELIF